ncbi:MAG: PAS domain-containing protein [Thermodesulfobacteriota bacterium]
MLRKHLGDKYRFMQAVIDGVADPIIVVGIDFRVKLMNRAARDYSRCGDLALDELPHCHQLIFGLAETCDHVGRACPLLMMQTQRSQVRVEHEHVSPDGQVRTFEILASPLWSEEGELLGMVESLRDVTERKEAAALLRSGQERLEAKVRARTAELAQAKEHAELLYRVSPSAIFTVDRQGLTTSWNDKAEEITGYNRAEMLGQPCHSFLGRQSAAGCCPTTSGPDHAMKDQECVITDKAGRRRVIRLNTAALRNIGGEVFGFIGSFEDVTEWKRTEDALRTERDKFRSMLSALGQGMHILNRNYEIEYQNDILRDKFGNRLGEKCYQIYKQRDTPCEVCRMHAAIESGAIQRTEEVMANGRFYEQSYAPFMDVDGETKVLIFLRDITEEKALQAETMRAGQLASIGELAAGVAHEINNPINGIINYAQVLLDEGEGGGRGGEEVLQRIIKEGERIAGIVRNLLAFARQREESVEEVAIAAVIDDALALIRHQLLKDGVTITLEAPAGLPPVWANPQQLQQVFLNLFSNARYALNQRYKAKTAEKKLEIVAAEVTIDDQPWLRTTVKDYGTGIPPEIMGHIFEPFFSSKKPGEGTGLGLSISHGLIRDMRGRLHAESEPGHFTAMMIDLPLARPAAVAGQP